MTLHCYQGNSWPALPGLVQQWAQTWAKALVWFFFFQNISTGFEMTQIKILFWMASGETVHKILLLLAKTVHYQHTVIKEHTWVITVCRTQTAFPLSAECSNLYSVETDLLPAAAQLSVALDPHICSSKRCRQSPSGKYGTFLLSYTLETLRYDGEEELRTSKKNMVKSPMLSGLQ